MINPASETEESIRIKRLIYRSWHRGCKETDGALGGFAKARLMELSEENITLFEQLLDEDDWDIWNWLTNKTPSKPSFYKLIEDIQAYIQESL